MTDPDDGPEIPLVEQGDLDLDAAGRVLDDIASEAEVLAVRIKGAPEEYSADDAPTLARGRTLFEQGVARGLQVRYRWRGQSWTDTLLRIGTRVRVVRVASPE